MAIALPPLPAWAPIAAGAVSLAAIRLGLPAMAALRSSVEASLPEV